MRKSHRQKVADRRKKRQRRGRQKFYNGLVAKFTSQLKEMQASPLAFAGNNYLDAVSFSLSTPVCVTNPHWRNGDSIFPDNYKIDTSLPSDKRPMTTAEIDRLTFFGFPEDTNQPAEPAEKGE